MTFPFTRPPKIRELAAESRQSYWTAWRLTKAGVAPTVSFPDGERIKTEWANRYVVDGLTEDELRRYREYFDAIKAQRQQSA